MKSLDTADASTETPQRLQRAHEDPNDQTPVGMLCANAGLTAERTGAILSLFGTLPLCKIVSASGDSLIWKLADRGCLCNGSARCDMRPFIVRNVRPPA